MLKDFSIRKLADSTSYERGLLYYRQGRIDQLKAFGNGVYTAVVYGSSVYKVHLHLSEDEATVNAYSCSCPAATRSYSACKHVIAVLKEIQDFQRDARAKGNNRPMDYSGGARMLQLFQNFQKQAPAPSTVPRKRLHLEPHFWTEWYYDHAIAWLEFKIGADKLYVLKDIAAFLRSAEDGSAVTFGKHLTVDTSAMQFEDGPSERLWQMLLQAKRDAASAVPYGSYFGRYSYMGDNAFQQRRFRLTPSRIEQFLECMGDTEFWCHPEGAPERLVRIARGNPPLGIQVADRNGAGEILLQTEEIRSLDPQYRFIVSSHHIFITDESFQNVAAPIFKTFGPGHPVIVSPKDMPLFLGTVLPKLEPIAEVEVADSFADRFQMEPLQAEFYIDYFKDGIQVRPAFHYGEIEFNPLQEGSSIPAQGKRALVRETEAEGKLLSLFDAYGFQRKKGLFLQEDEEASYDFLKDALPALSEQADIFYAEAFQKKPIQRMARVTAGVSVNDSNLLEVTLHADEIDFDEILDILASYRQKRRYHRLKDGSFVTLEEQQLAAVADLVDSTGIRKGGLQDDKTVELPLSHAMYLDSLAREDEGIRLERSARFRSIVRDIRHPADASAEVPQQLSKVLRDYQITGFQWLSTLSAYGLGGILADDMGLGKTLQVLAFLLSQKDDRKAPALVVAPTSLLYNWADEIQRFTPELNTVIIGGNREERAAALDALDNQVDIAITTYHMLARDIKSYSGKRFSFCFLDEAQHIKNPSTQKAKAVKLLKASVCFALTGTPIENTLTELWSIFDFLMPGYLLGHTKFKQRYETPIVRAQDAHATKDLKRHVAPFILRRLKRDVLRELPDKVERRMVNEMTDEQEKVYRSYFVQAKKEFAQELEKHGFGESRIKILALLTRLRQIACDPSLFLENYEGGSGKLEVLEEVVTDAVESGHRMLIFSQFTTMLQHIAAMLKQMEISYFYLDGQTPSLERIRLVKRFNEGAVPVFLISLKAGGTGLNLTGADMVIHFDPWWNPAVEDQATDRAYRIGQQNNVQVLKLITKNTIEEQIYDLQEKKKSLIDKMIEPGENFLSKLTDEEIRSLFQ